MEILCSGNYENVLELIEKAHSYYVWVQTSEDDGFYDMSAEKNLKIKWLIRLKTTIVTSRIFIWMMMAIFITKSGGNNGQF